MKKNKLTINGEHYRQEIKFMLKHKPGRIFLMRLITEGCHVFDVGFETNASAYALLSVQDLGKKLMNVAKEIDFEKFQLAEREYRELIDQSRQEQKKQEDAENDN